MRLSETFYLNHFVSHLSLISTPSGSVNKMNISPLEFNLINLSKHLTEQLQLMIDLLLETVCIPFRVHRPYRTLMSHYGLNSSLCPNKSGALCREAPDSNESFCWRFHFTDMNNEAKLPHLATPREWRCSGEACFLKHDKGHCK